MSSIGVCIPTYNRPEELERLLASIGMDAEVFVSDNGDYLTAEFRVRHPRVRFAGTGGPVVGMFANWNRAARMADTEWLVVPSDDDIYFPGAFDRIRSAIAAHPQAEMLVFGHSIVGDAYEVSSTWSPPAQALSAPLGFERAMFGVDARMPSVLIRRSAMERLGFFDEGFVYAASDSDLMQRALLACDTVFVPDVISGYRVWEGGATRATLATQGWLADVDRWGARIEALLRAEPRYAGIARRVRDELYASNLLAGLALLRRNGERARCHEHFRQSRYPFGARLGTQLRIMMQLARALV